MAAVSKGLSNRYLNKFFNDEVTLRSEETRKAKDVVYGVVNKLLEYINKEDKRFSSKAMEVGSWSQGLKIRSPDEFDFNIVLDCLGEYDVKAYKRRYYGFSESMDDESLKKTPDDVEIVRTRVPLPDAPVGYTFLMHKEDEDTPYIWRSCTDMIFDDDIIPYLVRIRLKKLLLKAIRDLGLRGVLRLGKKVHGPALTLRIPYNKDDIDEITVDFAPTVPQVGFIDSETQWPPHRVRWPSREKVKEIKAIPLCAIAKKPFDWLISYTESEDALLYDIDKDGGCRKKSLRIMKRFREMYWCLTTKPVITSYHLKNVLFLACEHYPSEEDWFQEKMLRRVMGMTKYLLNCFQKRFLPQYFNRKVNLFQVKSQNDEETLELELRNINEFLQGDFLDVEE